MLAPITGQCSVDPVEGVTGDIYNHWVGDPYAGLDYDPLAPEWASDSTLRKIVNAQLESIAAAIVATAGGGGGAVASVTGTAPITSTGGANPAIGIAYTVSAKSSNFTAALGVHYEVDTTGGDVTCTLPTATAGRDLTVAIAAGTNKVTFSGTVNGDAGAYIQAAGSCVSLRGLGGSSWRVV